MLAHLSTARKRNYTLSMVGLAILLSLVVLALSKELYTSAPGAPPSQNLDFDKLPHSFEPTVGQAGPSF